MGLVDTLEEFEPDEGLAFTWVMPGEGSRRCAVRRVRKAKMTAFHDAPAVCSGTDGHDSHARRS
jgi:hypothetical protein